MSLFKRGKFARRKRKLSPEHRQALIDANTGKTVSQETRDRIGDANRGRLKGVPRTQEDRDKISRAKKGMTFSKEWMDLIAASKVANGRITGATYRVSCLRCHLDTLRWYFDGIHVHICRGVRHAFGPIRIIETPEGRVTEFFVDGIPFRFSSVEELILGEDKMWEVSGIRRWRWLQELAAADVEILLRD